MRRSRFAAVLLLACAGMFVAVLVSSVLTRTRGTSLRGTSFFGDTSASTDSPWLPVGEGTSSSSVPFGSSSSKNVLSSVPGTASSSSSSSPSFPSSSSSSSSAKSVMPDIDLSISDGRSEAAPGDVLTYWITVVNNGSDAIMPLSVSLSDAGLFSSVTPPPDAEYDGQLGIVRWNAVLIPAGGISLRFDARIAPIAPEGTPFTALAQAAGDYAQDTTIVRIPSPKIGCVSVNVSAVSAAGSPTVPPELIVEAIPSDGSPAIPAKRSDTNLWSLTGIPAGNYVISAKAPGGWNFADGQSTRSVSVVEGASCAPTMFSIKQQPSVVSFSVVITPASSAIKRGDTVPVSVIVTNTGPDPIPAGTPVALSVPWPLIVAAPPSGGVIAAQGGGAQWNASSFLPGQSRTFVAAVAISSAAQSVTPNAPLVLTAAAASATTSNTIFIQPLGSCIIVKKTAFTWNHIPLLQDLNQFGFSVLLDDSIEQLVGSDGTAIFSNVSAGIHRIKERFVSGWNPTGVSPPNGTVTVPDGECRTVTFENTREAPPLALAFNLSLTGDPARPDVAVPGGLVRHSLSVLNTSADGRSATDVAVRLALPQELRYAGGAEDTGGAYDPASHAVTWKGLALKTGVTSLWFDTRVAANAPGGAILQSVGVVSGPGFTQMTSPANIRVESAKPSAGCVTVTQEVIPATNMLGMVAAVALPNAMPFDFRIMGPSTGGMPQAFAITASPTGFSQQSGQPVMRGTQTLSGLPPGTYLISAFPASGFTPAITADGASYATLHVPEGSACASAAFRSKPVPGEPRFAMEKTDKQETAAAGQYLTMEITVRNTSDVPTASPVLVTDVLPPQLQFVSGGNGIPAQYDPETRAVGWGIPSLNPAQSVTVAARVRVDPLLSGPYPVTIANTAVARYGGAPAGSATDVTVVQKPPSTSQTGCLRVSVHSKKLFGTDAFPQPPFLIRLDDNEVLQPVNPYGIALFEKIPVGQHTVAEILPPQSGPVQWKLVSISPSVADVKTAGCADITVVNKEVNMTLMTDNGACGDGICASAPWLTWPESCASCPFDCGVCPISSPASSSVASTSPSSSSVSSPSSVSSSSSSSSWSSTSWSSSSSSSSMSSTSSASSGTYSSSSSALPYLWCDHRMIFPPVCPLYDPETDDPAHGTVMFQPPYVPGPGINPYAIPDPIDCVATCDRIKVIGECCRPVVGCQEAHVLDCGTNMFFPSGSGQDCGDAFTQGLCGGPR